MIQRKGMNKRMVGSEAVNEKGKRKNEGYI
jgi:hypothetical protein